MNSVAKRFKIFFYGLIFSWSYPFDSRAVSQAQKQYAAAQQASDELFLGVNAGLDNYLLIFSLIAFLMGIASFMPGIRKPGWGAVCIVLSLVILAAPSCVNRFTWGG